MASTEATSEESSAEELVASETEVKVISEDAEAADQSKHGATGGGTGVTDRVTDVYLGSNGFNIQYNQPIADGAKTVYIIPANTIFPESYLNENQDTSDTSKDRLIISEDISSQDLANKVYYHVTN